MRERADGRAWLHALPATVAACAERWSLELTEPPYTYASASIALPARRADGSDAVLKVQFPHPECALEAAALAAWNGRGAVRLLEHDPERWALLLERCQPGTSLAGEPLDAALDVAVELFPRLWIPAGPPFRPLAEEAAGWAASLPVDWEAAGRPFERRLLDAAVDAIADLSGTQAEHVLLHQDLHADNILRAERAPWLAIDPKPLVGERAFGVAALVRGDELGREHADVLRRFDRLTGELGLDRERTRGWCIAQALAWGFDDGEAIAHHVDTVRWLLEDA